MQLRSHFEDALRLGKPVILGEFGKQHAGGMKQRRAFLESVYAEVEAWNGKHGNVAGGRCFLQALGLGKRSSRICCVCMECTCKKTYTGGSPPSHQAYHIDIIAAAGTFLWMLAADTYADYDGNTIYTTKRASKAPRPQWSDLTAEYMLEVRLGIDLYRLAS